MDDIPDVDYLEVCLEEIALEGLDGITLSALWTRLNNRPNFQLTLDAVSKSFLWEIFVLHRDLDFFVLEEPRPPLVIYNRFTNIDVETGLVVDAEEPIEDIYPFCLVTDGSVQGSCATYHSRRKVTEDVRTTTGLRLLSLDEVQKRWGECFVVVASPERRRSNLMGPETNPNLQLVPLQYALLERIGRSRYLGEVTLGANSLFVIHSCAKTLFYHRKALIKHHLITKQVHYQCSSRSKKSQLNNGMLFHLTRFYVERKSKIYHLHQELVKHLLSKPNHVDTVASVLSFLGIQHRSLRKEFHKNLKKIAELYYASETMRNWDPTSGPSQWYTSTKKERKVQVIRLFDDVNMEDLQSILNNDGEKQEEDDENEDDEDDPADGEDNDFGTSLNEGNETPLPPGILDQRNFLLDRPLLNQAYDVLVNAGSEGMSERELGRALGLPRLQGRAITRKLIRIGAVKTILRDKGRQTYNSIMANCYFGNSEHLHELVVEGQKLLQFASDTLPGTSRGQKSNSSTFLDDIRTMCETGNSSNLGNSSTFVTLRFLKRANTILKTVHDAKLVDSPFALQKVIVNSEDKLKNRIDRRTFFRIVNRLCNVKLLKSVKSILKQGTQERKIHFICVPYLMSTDPLITSALEHAKIKYFTNPKAQTAVLDPVQQSAMDLRSLCEEDKMLATGYIPQNGTFYGYKPKFVRMKLLHHYMFYLVYEYSGNLIDPSDSEYPKELQELLDDESVRVPPLYQAEKSWKMFLAPMPTHTGWKPGWCLFSDILLRLPLCLLTKLLNVNFIVVGLEKYLNHPIMRYYPITHLPCQLRSTVLFARKYIFSIYETATRLGYLGIMSFNQQHKGKDQAFFFVHRHACIVDTTTSLPEFISVTPKVGYAVQHYEFNSSVDVELYWGSMESICINTPLGSYSKFESNSVLEMLSKKSHMVAAIASKSDEDIVDDGTIPGDGKGAGGLDSSFYSHLKRNWNWTSGDGQSVKKAVSIKKCVTSTVDSNKPTSVIVKFLLKEGSMPPNTRKRLTRLAINNQLAQLTNKTRAFAKTIVSVKKNSDRVKRGRQILPRKLRPRRIRKPYYDEKDRVALSFLTQFRVSWSAKEDSLLLIFKVASCLLEPKRKRHMTVPFTTVRDLLHKHIEESKNKTSRACQRRMRYMMLNNETSFNVSVFIGESRDDKIIKEICDKGFVPMTNNMERIKRFEEVVERLLVKFKSSESATKMRGFELPDTLEQLLSLYNVVPSQELLYNKQLFTDVKDVTDIHFGVVYALILSSVGSLSDHSNWGHIMYQIYQQYPESLLNSAVTKLRSELVLSRHKKKGRCPIDRGSLLTFPFRLSNRYQYLFLSSYRETVFKEAYGMLRDLINENCEGEGVDVTAGHAGGSAATIVSLFAGRRVKFDMDIPENIISLKMDDVAINEHGQKFIQNFYQWENGSKSKDAKGGDEDDIEPPTKKKKIDEASTSKVEAEAESQDVHEAILKLNKSSRFALYMVRSQMTEPLLRHTQGTQDCLAINACRIKCSLNLDGGVLFNSFLEKASPLIDKLVRFVPEEETNIETVVEKYELMGLGERLIGEMMRLQEYLNSKRELGATLKELRAFAEQEPIVIDLKQHLTVMVDSFLVLKVGLASVRYVLALHAHPWLLHTFKAIDLPLNEHESSNEADAQNDSEMTNLEDQTDVAMKCETDDTGLDENRSDVNIRASLRSSTSQSKELTTNVTTVRRLEAVKCVCRPWRKPNGDLSSPILNEMLHSVMSHVMCFPGTSYETICTKYATVLSPVQLLELLQVLEESRCVYRKFVRRSHKPSLFSPPVTISINEGNDEDDDIDARYHPTIDCILNLSNVMYSDQIP